MGNVIKANRYRLVDNHPFEMPLPLDFSILKKDKVIAEYNISEDMLVSCNIVTKYKEEMLTTVHRDINISDIYYLFSCRVFQDMTPFTQYELDRFGIEKYNVYTILQKTHGMTPYDKYWIRFSDDSCTYEEALEQFNVEPPKPMEVSASPAIPASFGNVNEILHQHKVDFSTLAATAAPAVAAPVSVVAPEAYKEPEEQFENNKMSQDDIEALLNAAGVASNVDDSADDDTPHSYEGGQMTQDDIAKLFANAATAPSSEKMSDDDISKLFESATAALTDTAPASTSNEKMDEDAIAALFAANAEPEPAPEPEPVVETPDLASEGGKLSQDAIAALFAANAEPEPTPEPEPVAEAPASTSGGGKMSQDAIEALLNSMKDDATV